MKRVKLTSNLTYYFKSLEEQNSMLKTKSVSQMQDHNYEHCYQYGYFTEGITHYLQLKKGQSFELLRTEKDDSYSGGEKSIVKRYRKEFAICSLYLVQFKHLK